MPERVPTGFSWSASRANQFENCSRAYFFHYYLAVKRAIDADPERVQEARRLKNMTTIPMWVGSQIHDTIEESLRAARTGRIPDVEAQIEIMLGRMRRDYRDSLDNRAVEDPRQFRRFHEHEYGPSVPGRRWKQLVDEAVEMVRVFVRMEYLERIRDLDGEEVLALENLEKWEFENVPVWVKIDLAYRDTGGKVNILDWKTGRKIRDDNPLQMMGYAAFAEQAWSVPPDQLAVREVYLRLEDPEKWCTVDEEQLERARDRIRDSIESMIAALPDPTKNVAAEEYFEPLPEPRKCARCFYRSICPAAAV